MITTGLHTSGYSVLMRRQQQAPQFLSTLDSVKYRGPAPVRDAGGQVRLSAARAMVLEILQQRSEPVRVGDLAGLLGQHDNTVRAHLDELVEAGLAVRRRAAPDGRGRPAWLYEADPTRSEPDVRVREHAALAGALAAHIAATSADPEVDARAAGEVWGRNTARARHPGGPLDRPKAARQETVNIMADLGFDPAADDTLTTVALKRCPMLDVARAQPDVVCQVHLGLIRGALDELGGDASRADLIPFAEPGACRLHLMTRAPRGPRD